MFLILIGIFSQSRMAVEMRQEDSSRDYRRESLDAVKEHTVLSTSN